MNRALTAAAVLVLLGACSRGEVPAPTGSPRTSVVLISIDTLRADRLPVYGYGSVETPAIDQLARDGIVFDDAWSPCPMTLPSHVSMLTGLLPTTHGVRNNLGFRHDATRRTSLPQRLAREGYATGAAVSTYVLRGETGMRDMFDFYEDGVEPQPGARFVDYQRPGAMTAAVAEQWLETVRGRPYFLFLHLYEPHVPYAPPEPFRSRFRDPYDGEIAAADDIVGRFVQQLKNRGLYDDAVVIVTSDHGEGLGDHGEEQHSILLYREAIRVPLIVKLPRNERAGTRVPGNAALIDLVPTLEARLGLSRSQSDGVDLLAGSIPDRDLYAETIYPYVQLGWSDLRSIVRGRLHYIDSPRPELYDLASDPRETKDVIADYRREAARFRSIVATFPPPTIGNASIDPEEAKKLAALGYIGSVAARPDPRTLPNPREHVRVMEEVRDAFVLAGQHRYPEAIRRMQEILRAHPRLVDVWARLAEVFLTTGQVDRSIHAYQQAIAAAGPDLSSDLVASLGSVFLQAGRVDDAARAAEVAERGSPDKARRLRVAVALARGDAVTAERIARELRAAGTGAEEDLLLAEVLQAQGRHAEALTLISAVELKSPAPVFNLDGLRGESLARMERHPEAIAALEREVARFPSNLTAYSRLAILYFITGDRQAVERTLDRMVSANPVTPARVLAERTRRELH